MMKETEKEIMMVECFYYVYGTADKIIMNQGG